jgi:hypothetical protein
MNINYILGLSRVCRVYISVFLLFNLIITYCTLNLIRIYLIIMYIVPNINLQLIKNIMYINGSLTNDT